MNNHVLNVLYTQKKLASSRFEQQRIDNVQLACQTTIPCLFV